MDLVGFSMVFRSRSASLVWQPSNQGRTRWCGTCPFLRLGFQSSKKTGASAIGFAQKPRNKRSIQRPIEDDRKDHQHMDWILLDSVGIRKLTILEFEEYMFGIPKMGHFHIVKPDVLRIGVSLPFLLFLAMKVGKWL